APRAAQAHRQRASKPRGLPVPSPRSCSRGFGALFASAQGAGARKGAGWPRMCSLVPVQHSKGASVDLRTTVRTRPAILAVWVSLALAVASCVLSPQPEPPGTPGYGEPEPPGGQGSGGSHGAGGSSVSAADASGNVRVNNDGTGADAGMRNSDG